MSSTSHATAPSPSARLLLGLLAARLAFGLSFLVSAARRSPVWWYLPLERRFVFSAESPGRAMDWYGRTLLGLGFALAAFGLAYAASRRVEALARPGVVVGLARASAAVLLVDFVYFAAVILGREPDPWPLPDWYCPR